MRQLSVKIMQKPIRFIAPFGALLLGILFFAPGCSYTIKIKDGPTAYERKQYAVAIPMLEKEYGRSKSRVQKGKLAFLIGDSYRKSGKEGNASNWFKIASENSYGPEALKALAYSLKKQERFAEAGDAFKNLGIEIGSPYEYRREITACKIAADWLKEAPDSGWKITAEPFNSPQNDFSPTFYGDGRLVFTSDRRMGKGDANYQWTGNRFMDLFIVGAGEASAQVFDPVLNTKENEGTAAFSPDFKTVFFVRTQGAYKDDDRFCKIFFSNSSGGSWSEPEPLPFQKDRINYMHPCMAADGVTLYFASNDPDGWGGFDIYSAVRTAKTETGWTEPKLLGRSINTSANDAFPVLDADTLYFASEGHTGMGGFDVFKTYKTDKTAWAPPINLKAPINSGADDFGLIIDHKTDKSGVHAPHNPGDLIRSGFLTTNRAGGAGGDDIYKFEQRVPVPKPVPIDTTPPKPIVYKMILEGYVLEKIFAVAADPNSGILGRKPLENARVEASFSGKKQVFTVKSDGLFTLELAENTDYLFTATYDDYLTNTARFSTKGVGKDPQNPVQTFELEIVLDRIYKNREIVLDNIYYDYDKWDIRPDAEPTLNKLADILRQNARINIQLGSHTDCRGNDGYNQNLSQKRAESAVNYLISRGIDPARLSAIGYGESQPATSCLCSKCSEGEHQINRRTTFKIVD